MQPDESIESVHEANLLSKLDNPHILKYFDSFLDGEYFCIVTEYCEVIFKIRSRKLKKPTISYNSILGLKLKLRILKNLKLLYFFQFTIFFK